MYLKKNIIRILLLFLVSVNLFGTDYKAKYLKFLETKDFEKLNELLVLWEQDEAENPELYIAYFNYYLNRNYKSGIAITHDTNVSGTILEITDPETGEIIGYMGENSQYDLDDVQLALLSLNKGLVIRPDRLDMYFGKAHILQEISDYNSQGRALIDCLNTSIDIDNNWYWSDDEKLSDGKEFLINNMQDYYNSWFQVRSDESYKAIRSVSSLQMEIYPYHVYGYNNMAFSYLSKADYPEGLKYLLQAEKIDPLDTVIMNNIALTYKYMGDKEQAETYFKKLLEFPDSVDIEYVKSQIADL
jgi:tetratricopeptide (TPR) repeat protein